MRNDTGNGHDLWVSGALRDLRLDLRRAGPNDLAPINSVLNESVRSWHLPGRVLRLAMPSLHYDASDLKHMTVALLEDQRGAAVGVAAWEVDAALRPSADTNTGSPSSKTESMNLHGLYLTPHWHRRGIGTALVEAAVHWALMRDITIITTRAWRDAEPFFNALGFTPKTGDASDPHYPRLLHKALHSAQ